MVVKRNFNGDKDGSEPSKRRQEFQMRAFPRVFSDLEIQQFWEPFFRKVVQEELERVLQSIHPCPRSSTQPAASGVRSLHLRFVNALPSPIFTKNRLKAEDGSPIRIELFDTRSGTIVKAGPLSTIKLDIVVLHGDFCSDDHEDWTEQDFNASVVREREGKRPLLVGVLKVTLIEGAGCIGDIQFTDNSRWTRSGQFRLAAKVEQKVSGEVKIREATSRKIVVKDHRGESNKKHETPSLGDPIWRLKKIGRDGTNCKQLTSSGIQTIRDFLLQHAINPSKLRNLLKRVADRKWKEIIENAMASVANDRKLYAYHRAGERVGLQFNSIYQVVAATFDGHNYCPVQTLSLDEKHAVEVVKQQAYENINDWVPMANELSTVSFSRPSGSIQDYPFGVPEQNPQQFEFPLPVTHQVQGEIWPSFNQPLPSYPASHVHAGETSNQIEASGLQSNHPMPSNYSIDDYLIGHFNTEGNDFIIFPSNQADFGNFTFSNSGVVPISRAGKAAWCKIRAAARWSTVWRDVAAKRTARPICI
ncbi:calmodulin-binding protein 60 D-like [Carya illinoinensis]|uniref:calmodulin-binding protein 60 D-like n=1 Tax=Carya illinoinensis TaxID=32201 RepID=UPI001C728CC5|nr:calmodulin-binding protein 60 D-like [Carya illinoinensis]XP_042986554.1 calmodulin-binding protein 60 D-like [Carya illinoinensis]